MTPPAPGAETDASDAPAAFEPLAFLAVDPHGTGIVLRGGPGPVRDLFLARLRSMVPEASPWRRMPASIDEGRLLGGLDLTATLAAGLPVLERGVLALADGGMVVAHGAERLPDGTAALLAAALDQGELRCERDGLGRTEATRFGLVALDEGEPDEAVAPRLADRLAFRVGLDGLRHAEVEAAAPPDPSGIAAARALLPFVSVPAELAAALVEAADALGIASLRAPILAIRVARIAAALAGRTVATEGDAALAARLVLGPRATRLPAPAEAEADDSPEPQAPPPESEPDASSNEDDDAAPGVPSELILEAVLASLPPDLLAALAKPVAARSDGRSAPSRARAQRGRPIGNEPGEPRGGARFDLVATLRAAAPWQRLRKRSGSATLAIRSSDLRIRRFRKRTGSTAIFAVDASGSAALHRLAEAKGAVEHLLADCYVRRDQVAVIAFRGDRADLLLPPSGALARARRALRGLPGGGGTPLAHGLAAAGAMAVAERKRGRAPILVVLTDGRANIGRDGKPGREAAERDALDAARLLRGTPALVVDTAPRPEPRAVRLAAAMDARYLALPPGQPERVSRAVRAAVA